MEQSNLKLLYTTPPYCRYFEHIFFLKNRKYDQSHILKNEDPVLLKSNRIP